VDSTESRFVNDWYGNPVALPVALAEIQVPGLSAAAPSEVVDSGCRDDLLTIDGDPLSIRIVGSRDAAITGRGLAVEHCGSMVELGEGTHEIRSTAGRHSGFDVDRLVFSTPAWDEPPALASATTRVEVTSASSTKFTGTIES